MTSTTTQNDARELTSQLWAMANDLRGKMDASEYRDYILGFIFYRYLSKRQERHLVDSGLLDFTYGKQSVTFTLPQTEGNWALFLYAGVSGATTGVTVIFRKLKLEEGSIATSWQASPEETSETLGQLTEAVRRRRKTKPKDE